MLTYVSNFCSKALEPRNTSKLNEGETVASYSAARCDVLNPRFYIQVINAYGRFA